MALPSLFKDGRKRLKPQSVERCVALSPDPFLLLDGDRILKHSESFTGLFGLVPGDYRDTFLASLVSPPNHRRLSEILGQAKQAHWHPMTLARADGSTRQLEWHPLPPDENSAGIWWTVRDVTSRQRLEQAVSRAQDKEQARIARDLHDSLGQKLAGLGFQLYAHKTRLQQQGVAEAENLTRLIQITDEVIREVRDLAHGLAPVEISPDGLKVALRHLAHTTGEIFQTQCRFVDQSGEKELSAACANPLYRIAQEAIANAHRHGKASLIEIRLREKEGVWSLEIADNGRGLPPMERRQNEGLGLQIMRHRAEAIGGRFSLTSPGDQGGVTVVVELRQPSTHSRAPFAPLAAPPTTGMPPSSGQVRVALIDAHPMTRSGVSRCLADSGQFQIVAEGDSTQAAVTACSEQQVQLLVTDILLSDGSALDYIRQMRRVFPTLRIAVLSLYPPERYEKPALEAGADLYLGKHTPPDQLIAALRRLAGLSS